MSELDRVPIYYSRVDWNNDGTFNAAEDDLTSRRLSEKGTDISSGRDQARDLAPPMINQCDFAIDNSDKMYSPEYPASPTYQIQKPGRPVEIEARTGQSRLYRAHLAFRDHAPYRGR